MQSIQAVVLQTERRAQEARRTVDEIGRLAEEITASLVRFGRRDRACEWPESCYKEK
jgi:hypothetical protein